MFITVSIKTVYGRELIYPACDKSRLFAELVGAKTLTRLNLDYIRKLGYEIRLEPHPQAL